MLGKGEAVCTLTLRLQLPQPPGYCIWGIVLSLTRPHSKVFSKGPRLPSCIHGRKGCVRSSVSAQEGQVAPKSSRFRKLANTDYIPMTCFSTYLHSLVLYCFIIMGWGGVGWGRFRIGGSYVSGWTGVSFVHDEYAPNMKFTLVQVH